LQNDEQQLVQQLRMQAQQAQGQFQAKINSFNQNMQNMNRQMQQNMQQMRHNMHNMFNRNNFSFNPSNPNNHFNHNYQQSFGFPPAMNMGNFMPPTPPMQGFGGGGGGGSSMSAFSQAGTGSMIGTPFGQQMQASDGSSWPTSGFN
jgi:TolA-binding protein